MDQESIFCKARVAAQGLETLRQEHHRMIENLKAEPLADEPGIAMFQMFFKQYVTKFE